MEHFSVQIFLLCVLNKESKYNSQHEDLELVLEIFESSPLRPTLWAAFLSPLRNKSFSTYSVSVKKKHSRLSACAKLVYTPTSSIRASRKTTDSLALNLNWNNGGSISKWADYSHEGHCLCLRYRVNSLSFIAALVCYKMQLCCWSYQCRRGPFTAGTQLKLPSNGNKSLFCSCILLCCCCR